MSLNILYLGPLTKDGWGKACKEYLRALKTTDAHISYRPVYTSVMPGLPNTDLDSDILEMMNNHSSQYDAVILNLLPYYYEYNKKFGINVGLPALETCRWTNQFVDKMKLMDKMFVPSKVNQGFLRMEEIESFVIPEPVNPVIYTKEYPVLADEIIKDKVVFYWIGEYIPRKNLLAAVRAFHLAFNNDEPVEFVIKTNKCGQPHQKVKEQVEYDILHLKKEMGLYVKVDLYKKEYIFTEYFTDEQMCGLHQSCDVFVMPSSGEAWSLPMFDAFAFGNEVLTTETGCYREIMDENNKVDIINSMHEIVTLPSQYRPYPDLYTAKEEWLVPNILDMSIRMRWIYRHIMKHGKDKVKPDVSKFSHESVGRKMIECLS